MPRLTKRITSLAGNCLVYGAADRGPDSGNDSHWPDALSDETVPEVRIARQFRYDAADDECFDAQSSYPFLQATAPQ